MSVELHNIISELLKDSCRFNTNDVLVDCKITNRKLHYCEDSLVFSTEKFSMGLVKESNKILKETGVNPLSLAEGVVEINHNGQLVQSPIIITPLFFELDKIRKTIHFLKVEEDAFINPFLIHSLDLPENDVSIDNVTETLNKMGLTIQPDNHKIIGNFHHHRFQIIKELDDLINIDDFGTNVSSLFGFNAPTTLEHTELNPNNLFSADTDHEAVFKQIGDNNTVIQGPPGTGKSQVLTNVLGKLLFNQQTTLVVSEKRAALEVLVKKLSHFNLDRYCFIATSDKLSHSFLTQLKANWDYLESYSPDQKINLRLSEQYHDNLQMTLDLISQEKLIGGVSYHQFIEISNNVEYDQYDYSSSVPEIDVYLNNEKTIQEIFNQDLNQFIGFINKKTISQDNFDQIDTRIKGWINSIHDLSQVFTIDKWRDLKVVMKEAADCQILENNLYKKYASIFKPNSTEQKRFLRLQKKFSKAKLELDRIGKIESQWKIIPSLVEAESLLESIESSPSFFRLLKLKKRWKEVSHLPYNKAISELKRHIENTRKISAYSQIIVDFCELGLENPELDVTLIQHTIDSNTSEEWVRIHNIPSDIRSKITEKHQEIHQLYSDLKEAFLFESETNIITFLELLQPKLSRLIEFKNKLSKFDENTLLNFKYVKDFNAYKGVVIKSHWTRFKEQFPMYAEFSMNVIHDKVNNIITQQQMEANSFAVAIQNNIHERFNNYHELLNTPAKKLSDQQRELKARLRKGKSILVKEFRKTRSHPSLRELNNSEARDWIQLLKPVWLSNPSQLAKCFPFEKNIFDYTIFDEASQIPLQNSLGALYRSKRIIVAGDENQMGPSSYFKTGSTEPIDLLHQASYNWLKFPLKHHYRSTHPDLISFSNKHFYSNELNAFPAYNASIPIIHHYIEKGEFIDRKNEVEAQIIAKHIETQMTTSSNIGVVAFSEEQLICIWNALSPNGQAEITERLDKNNGFFKSLENVQGDECDQLIISFGYAQNEDGDFHMRFGPMNTVNGRKRLNVLLTRAIKSIDFFCSVKSTDFKLSDNESINLLRQWISFAEHYDENKTMVFPFGLHPEIIGNELTFPRINETLGNGKEIVTLQHVLENRGWKVNYS